MGEHDVIMAILLAGLQLSHGCGWFHRGWSSLHPEHGDEEQDGADEIKSGVEDRNGLSVSNSLGQGINQNGQVSSNVVHNKEEAVEKE